MNIWEKAVTMTYEEKVFHFIIYSDVTYQPPEMAVVDVSSQGFP